MIAGYGIILLVVLLVVLLYFAYKIWITYILRDIAFQKKWELLSKIVVVVFFVGLSLGVVNSILNYLSHEIIPNRHTTASVSIFLKIKLVVEIFNYAIKFVNFLLALIVIFIKDRSEQTEWVENSSTLSRKFNCYLCYCFGFFGAHLIYQKKYAAGIIRFCAVCLASFLLFCIKLVNPELMNFTRKTDSLFLLFLYVISIACIFVTNLIWMIELSIALKGKSKDANGNKINLWSPDKNMIKENYSDPDGQF